MNKSLKAWLLLAGSLLLVACGETTTEYGQTSTNETESSVVNREDEDSNYTIEKVETTDGGLIYTLTGEEDEHGWAVRHIMEIGPKGEIKSSDFNYINAEGELKTEDSDYVTSMEDKTDNNLPETIEYLNRYLEENNGVEGISDEVEVVSGATSTVTLFEETATELLAQV